MTMETRDAHGLLLLAGVAFLAVTGAGIFAFTVCAVAVVLTLSVALQRWRRQPIPGASFPDVERAYVTLLVFLALTAVPLPLSITAKTGAARYEQNARVAKALDEASAYGLPVPACHPGFSFTRSRAGTLRIMAIGLAMYGAAMISGGLSSRGRISCLRALVALGTALGLLGHVGQWWRPQGDTLLWIIAMPHGDPGPVGCFVNRNHFAGFLSLLCPAALALAADDVRRRRWVTAALDMLQGALMTLALSFSLSRGGVLALAVGMSATILALVAVRHRVVLAVTLFLCLLIASGSLILPRQPVAERLRSVLDITRTHGFQTRLSAWRDCLVIWAAYPIAGAGANAFRMVYPQYRTASSAGFMTHAHNEYAQLLCETGVIGLCMSAVLLTVLARRILPSNRPSVSGSTDSYHARIVTVPAAAGALAAAAAHATVEFALHAPLYAVVLASLVGLALRHFPADAASATRAAPRLPWIPAVSLLIALILTPLAKRMETMDSGEALSRLDSREAGRAMIWAPTSWFAWFEMGKQAAALATPDGIRFAERCITQAGEYDPKNYRLWKYLGELRLALGNRAGARDAFKRVHELRSWVNIPVVPEDRP